MKYYISIVIRGIFSHSMSVLDHMRSATLLILFEIMLLFNLRQNGR